ncbi:MAG: RelA/SpoT family protein [Candidatus Paceibacterota bacterium]|jgi:GTP pyrophosphokinase
MAGILLEAYPKESVVHKAYNFARDAHKEDKRENGDPYFSHCEQVAETVHEWHLDELSVAAALLHDVVEDTLITSADLEKSFGKEVAFLVDGLTKLKTMQYPEGPEKPEVENLRKFIISFSKDLRVVIIKLADRLHNMQTLRFLSKEQQERIAWETAEIYAPLAYRLGMQKLSGELEDLAFPYINPEEYRWLVESVADSYTDRLKYAKKVQPIILRACGEHNIRPLRVDSRAKRYYSLYKKLCRHDMDLEKIYDLVAIRIIVKTIEECYAVLGVVHQLWQPLHGQFDDYIARPKPNGYRSLHTTVFCLDNKIIEIQIRTQEMHEEAEMGIAAHWAYQQARNTKGYTKTNWLGIKSRGELTWVEQLSNWQENFTDKEKFIQSLKVDFFKERIFVITPDNDIIDLPKGATPVDFAYRIHSDVGDQCVGAKINKKIVPLDHELHSGDIVEIVMHKGKKPTEDWLRFVKTEQARGHIRSALRAKIRHFKEKTGPLHTEFKIINQDRPGYLKDVTAAFAELKTNITFLQSQTDPRRTFSAVTARCDALPEAKVAKLLVKLKKVQGTKEITFKFIE